MEQLTTDIGSRIRQARERRGLTIRDVAQTTKISQSALNAIEHNEFHRLPGGVFRRAYIRAVANEVGLDADGLTREYRARFEPETTAGPSAPRTTGWFDRVRPTYLLPIVVPLVGILIGGAVSLRRAQIIQEVPVELATIDLVDGDLSEDTVPTDERDSTEQLTFAANAAIGQPGGQSLRLEIRFNGPCWVSAVADGERAVYRLMQPGERTVVEARSLITLRVGDAGAVTYSINGVMGRPLGGNGEAVTVHITHDNLGRLSAEPANALPANGAAIRSRSDSVGRSAEASNQRELAT
jgi:cytoskeletal protein RodZ